MEGGHYRKPISTTATSTMGGKKPAGGGEGSKKAQGQARKADAAASKAAAGDAKREAAEAAEWNKGAKSNAKQSVPFSVSCSSIPANLPKGPLSTQCPGLGTFEVLRAAWTGLPPDPALSHILPTIYGRRWHRKALSCFPQDLNPPSIRRCIFGYTVLLIGPSHRAQPLARRISWAVKVVLSLCTPFT